MPENLFIIDLHYLSPLEKLDEAMKDHISFLDAHYQEGHFITSGRKVPRTGGIILARAGNKQEVEEWMAEDPFCKLGLSDFTVTEFLSSQAVPEFRKLLQDVRRRSK